MAKILCKEFLEFSRQIFISNRCFFLDTFLKKSNDDTKFNMYFRHLKVFEFKILLDKQKIPTFSGSTIILLVESIDVCVNIFWKVSYLQHELKFVTTEINNVLHRPEIPKNICAWLYILTEIGWLIYFFLPSYVNLCNFDLCVIVKVGLTKGIPNLSNYYRRSLVLWQGICTFAKAQKPVTLQ